MYKDITLHDAQGERFYIKNGALWDTEDESEPMMIDNEFERTTNQIFIDNARGHVLILGLGMGLIVKAIEDNPNVQTITIIEKYQEVIDLITSQVSFSGKVSIICADAFEYEPMMNYDTIWCDIWTTLAECRAMEQQGKSFGRADLIERYRPHLNSDGFIDYWKPYGNI